MSVPAAAVAGAVFTLSFPTRRSSDLVAIEALLAALVSSAGLAAVTVAVLVMGPVAAGLMWTRSEEHTSELQSRGQKVWGPLPAEMVQPALAETKLTWAGRTSVTVPPL